MSIEDIKQYYSATEHSEIREDLTYAVSLTGAARVAIDCGCGAGSDIAFLRQNGFTVHAFDIEEESIRRCRKRYSSDPGVHLSVADFSGFEYPNASLVVADASLFFCPRKEFNFVWSRIEKSLRLEGFFAVRLLDPKIRWQSRVITDKHFGQTLRFLLKKKYDSTLLILTF